MITPLAGRVPKAKFIPTALPQDPVDSSSSVPILSPSASLPDIAPSAAGEDDGYSSNTETYAASVRCSCGVVTNWKSVIKSKLYAPCHADASETYMRKPDGWSRYSNSRGKFLPLTSDTIIGGILSSWTFDENSECQIRIPS